MCNSSPEDQAPAEDPRLSEETVSRTPVDRRTLLKALSYGTLSAAGGLVGWRLADRWQADHSPGSELPPEIIKAAIESAVDPVSDEGSLRLQAEGSEPIQDQASYLEKIRNFDEVYAEDVILDEQQMKILESTARRLTKAQRVIGHGHFNLVSFDDLLKYCRRFRSIGRMQPQELDFLEEIFAADAADYGFFGEKVQTEMTAVIPERDVVKIAGTGHFLFRGEPENKYAKMCKDLDGNIFLTSGIRSVVKQMQLFLDKAVSTDGNLSQASRSLAPPGYSFHAVGDFDIGKVGAGLDNFNEVFAETDEYKKLVDLGYVELRYTPTNPFGVRHEPWHIKMKA
ncbi:MAG: D-alanyl-D-alanine carboxypeptidase family protein [Acidobacteriota bacterium]